MRILLIDDDDEVLRLLCHYLAPLGEVVTSSDGRDGLVKFQHALDERAPYHLVCLDLHMQGATGQQTLLALRRLEQAAGTPHDWRARVIMTTGEGARTHVERALAGGCDAYLLKPFSRAELLDRVAALGLAVPEGGADAEVEVSDGSSAVA